MNKRLLFLAVALFLFSAGFTYYVLVPKDAGRKPINIQVNSDYPKLSLDELIAQSDLIVLGTVSNIYASRWNTSDGRRPQGDLTLGLAQRNLIFTDREFNIIRLIKGVSHLKNARIRFLGGEVDGDRTITNDAVPEMNKVYMLFLNLDTSGTTASIVPGHYWITGGFQGMYEISGDQAISAVDARKQSDLIDYIERVVSAAP